MRRKSLMSGSEGGCWKSGTLRAQLAGFLPYVKYGFEGKTEGVTSPSHPTFPQGEAKRTNKTTVGYLSVLELKP